MSNDLQENESLPSEAAGRGKGGESIASTPPVYQNAAKSQSPAATPEIQRDAVETSARIDRANRRRQAEPGAPDLDGQSKDAERALLGAILLDSVTAFATPAVCKLTAADFRDPLHQLLFLDARKLAKDGPVDLVLLADDVARMPTFDKRIREQADLPHLLDLVDACLSVSNVGKYAEVVRDWSRQREARTAITALGASFGGDGRFERSLADTAKELTELSLEMVGDVAYSSMDAIRAYFGDVTWAWPSWIPVGHLSMLCGPQGVGKSWLAARLIATLTGCIETWPDGTPFTGLPPDGNPAKVLLVETEEMRGVYAERLETMGVDPHWVIFGPGDPTHVPDLVREADAIEQLAKQEGTGAIVVDSLSGGHGMKEDGAEMRGLLKRYTGMAARLGIPIILVHHARKKGELEPPQMTLDRVRGSTTITQFCRSVIGLYRLNGGIEDPVRLEIVKATFTAPPEPLGFTIGDNGLTFGDAPEPERTETQLDKAVDMLRALLVTGPVSSTVLQDEADGAGISWDTMKRAKDRLHIVAKRDGKERKWSWGLPAHV